MSTSTTQTNGLMAHVQRHPYQTLLIATGVGYVLGGGLFTRFTMKLLQIGVRMGALPLVRRELLSVAEAALSSHTNP